MYYNLFHLSGW